MQQSQTLNSVGVCRMLNFASSTHVVEPSFSPAKKILALYLLRRWQAASLSSDWAAAGSSRLRPNGNIPVSCTRIPGTSNWKLQSRNLKIRKRKSGRRNYKLLPLDIPKTGFESK